MNFAPFLFLALLASAPSGAHASQAGILTDRPDHAPLRLPADETAFTFAVFGDRTGGPAEGVRVLEQAVRDVNLVGPDLVMTVGDLVQGYNQTPEWMVEMAEFKSIMDGLACPWFPVAGNHDIYWRGPDKPDGEHETNYERHFGPLWYGFEHKDAWFIVLYTDEGDPATGAKSFGDPDAQRMSPAQFEWLAATLKRAAAARHVFVFVHHPRWIEARYGEDWRRVHALLVATGNVRAVFGGHIHYMRSDPMDGIDYFSLATVGGYQDGFAPKAGFVDQYHLVTVRDERIDVAAYPVGAALDPRQITGELAEELRSLHRKLTPTWGPGLAVGPDAGVGGVATAVLTNPTSRPIQIDAQVGCEDRHWDLGEAHRHLELKPGESRTLRLALERRGSFADFAIPRLSLATTLLAEGFEVPLALRSFQLPLDPAGLAQGFDDERPDGVLVLDGEDDCVVVPHDELPLADGPFTLEFWVRADRFAERQGLVAKTESAEFGFFASRGVPEFLVNLDGEYHAVRGAALEPERWYHLAGVFDGAELRLYVDGELQARSAASGVRVTRDVPLLVGADVRGNGDGMSFLAGRLDDVHLATGALYSGERFEPARHRAVVPETVLFLPMHEPTGPWMVGAGPLPRVFELRGAPAVVLSSEPKTSD